MDRESITLVVSDVFGTFTSENQETRKETLEMYYENLRRIKEENNSDYLLFCFITSESQEVLDKINDFDCDDITIGNNFCDFKGSRPIAISNYVDYLKKEKRYKIDEVWYFDASRINAYMYENLFPRLQKDIETLVINPKEGLDDVNNQIEAILDEREFKLNENKKL